MPRNYFIAGNWKMNHTPQEGASLVRALRAALQDYDQVEVAVCPSFPALPAVVEAAAG